MNRRKADRMRRSRGNVLFAPAFFLGILAGISIPAYQDYTLRSHVAEGLILASSLKASVTEHFFATGRWPRDLRELKFESAPRGRYVTFAALNHGTVVIRYSGAAGAHLARTQLTLRPTISSAGEVIWSCGYAPDRGSDPPGRAAAPHATTVPARYLPSMCRG